MVLFIVIVTKQREFFHITLLFKSCVECQNALKSTLISVVSTKLQFFGLSDGSKNSRYLQNKGVFRKMLLCIYLE